MVILAQSSNSQNCIKKSNKIPEYARDFKKEYLFIRGINKECFLFLEKYETEDTQIFNSSHSDRIKYFIKRFLKFQERCYIKDTSFLVFKKCDVYNIENLFDNMQYDFKEKNELTKFLGYRDFFNLFCKFYEKINFRKYDDDDDDYVKPTEYLSDPRIKEINFVFDFDSYGFDSDSDGVNSDDLEFILSDSDSD